MDTAEIQDLLDEVALDSLKRVENRPFNQPSLITISSANQEIASADYTPYSDTAFASFSVNLPRPALDVKSLQLLSTNIPQSNANLPNTACGFWYYRLSEYSGLTPTINNLYYVRLLPSTYKQEFIADSSLYGFNKTFNSYSTLSTQLAKSCATDLLFNNLNKLWETDPNVYIPNQYYVPFIPNDVLVEYDSSVNKFQMTGLNTQVVSQYYNANTLYSVGTIIANEDGTFAFSNKVSCKGVLPPNPLNPASNTLPAWVSGTTYTLGNVVYDPSNNVVYKCILNGANVNQHPYAETTHWSLLGHYDLPFLYPDWVSGTNYNVGQSVLYEGSVYVLTQNGEGTTTPPPNQPLYWTALTTLVRRYYFWEVKYGMEIVEQWSVDVPYSKGMIVSYNNQTYQANIANINAIPTNPTYWEEVSFSNWYKYLITGYDDPNVKKLQGELFDVEWNAYTTYRSNEVITWKGESYIANFVNVNQEPSPTSSFWTWYDTRTEWSPTITYPDNGLTKWGGSVYYANYENTNFIPAQDIATEWTSAITFSAGQYGYDGNIIYRSLQNGNINHDPATSPTWWVSVGRMDAWTLLGQHTYYTRSGLYGMTRLFDFIEIDDAQYDIRTNYPYGVGGQPYNPNPKRLLNSILGFTWNGRFNPLDFSNISESSDELLVEKKFPALYNRLRPVPLYLTAIQYTPPTLYVAPPTTASSTLTFTADSYANLVYSSVVSIYANIVGASSVDTQQDTRLLAITSMNCGTLGVAFWNNYVDNPLLKVAGDIYNIYIEFRDEFGEPYWLSNNAVATLTFKASY